MCNAPLTFVNGVQTEGLRTWHWCNWSIAIQMKTSLVWDSPAWRFVWHVQNLDLNHKEIMTTSLHTQQRIKQITDLATNCVILFKLKMLGSVAKPTLHWMDQKKLIRQWGGPVWTLRYRVWNSPCRNAKSKLARLPTVQIWVHIHFVNPLCLSIFGSLV